MATMALSQTTPTTTATNDALYKAAANGDRATLRALLAQQAHRSNINARFGRFSETALHTAIDHNHTECSLDLIQAGASVTCAATYNVPPLFGSSSSILTPLIYASACGNATVVSALLAAGASVHEGDLYGWLPLHIAAQYGDPACVTMLIQAGAGVNTLASHGGTALTAAAERGHTAIVKLLLAAGGNVNVGSAAPLLAAVTGGHEDCVALLLSAGSKVECRNEDGDTALTIAAANGHTECALLLLQAGARATTASKYFGRTPLQLAVENGHEQCAALLLAFGARVNAKGGCKESAMHIAVEGSHHACLSLLVQQAGADAFARNLYGYTPLELAAKKGDTTSASLLLPVSKDALVPRRVLGLSPSHAEAVLFIFGLLCVLLGGAAACFSDRDMHAVVPTCLGLCCYAMQYLLGSRETNRVNRVCSVRKCLVLAAEHDHADCVSLLLAGATRLSSRSLSDALRQASYSGHVACVSFLLQAGAPVDDGDPISRSTALHRAAGAGQLEVVVLLLQAGATLTVTNRQHLSPLEVAVQERRPQVARLLAAAAKQFSVKPEVCRPRAVTSRWQAKREARQPATMKAVQGESRWRRRRGLALLREQRVAARDARNARLVHKHVVVE